MSTSKDFHNRTINERVRFVRKKSKHREKLTYEIHMD